MIFRLATIAATIALGTAPAFAQFPPPGVYQCIDMNGAAPLADIDLSGSFTLDERGEASFMFTTTLGSVLCALPAG